jgi:signal transduction histidine kinase/HD-like signal output (HDOD) protein
VGLHARCGRRGGDPRIVREPNPPIGEERERGVAREMAHTNVWPGRRILFVEDDLDDLFLIQRAFAAHSTDWEMAFTRNAHEALDMFEERPFDIVVSDLRMPGMSGTQLLNAIRAIYPRTVRILVSGFLDRESIASAVGPCHQCLQKPLDVEMLRKRIERAFTLRDAVWDARMLDLIGGLETIPTLPALHESVVAALDEGLTAADVGKLLAHDAGLSAKLLQLANSSYCGGLEVESLPDAATLIGVEMLQSMVLGAKTFEALEPADLDAVQELWAVGVRSAAFARTICQLENTSSIVTNQAMVASFVQDVGLLLIASHNPELFSRVWRTRSLPSRGAESANLGASHESIGACLIALWGLPEAIVEAVAFHHTPSKAGVHGIGALAVLHVAQAFAHAMPRSADPHALRAAGVDLEFLRTIGALDRVPAWLAACASFRHDTAAPGPLDAGVREPPLDAVLDYRVCFEKSPEMLLVLLPDAPRYTIVAATDAYLAKVHLTRERICGKALFEIFPDNPDDPKAVGVQLATEALERMRATHCRESLPVLKYDIRNSEGRFERRQWSVESVPVISAESEILYILVSVEDVTDELRASEMGAKLLGRNSEMKREVLARSQELADRNRELREANEKLGQLDAAKTAFFSNVSHEFRTPLTLMLGPLEDALASPSESLTASQRARLELAHGNALRLLKLVNGLLDFSRLEAGRMQASFAPADIARITTEIAGMFESAMMRVDLALTIRCPALSEPAWIDRDLWEKIVTNLVSNAFKFTLSGEIRVEMSETASSIVLEVADTGVGIPERELPRIFDRFHRVPGIRGRTHEGSGIGLALVRELVVLHGGRIEARSEVQRGTTMRVEIPKGFAHLPAEAVSLQEVEWQTARASAPHVAEASRWTDVGSPFEPAAPPDGTHPAHVLVVDDNADLRRYLCELLAPAYTVSSAADGVEALRAIRERRPDLVVSDVMMPQLDGLGLLRELRADPQLVALPVILLSARAGEEAAIEGLDMQCDDYLFKPFSARELLARVRTHLNLARMRHAWSLEIERKSQELARSNADLRAEMARRESAEAQLRLAQKLESLGRLAAGIAHEINTPIHYIGSNLSFADTSLKEIIAAFGSIRDVLSTSWPEVDALANEVKSVLDGADVDFLAKDVPAALAESMEGVKQVAELIRSMKELALPPGTEVTSVDLNHTIQTSLTLSRNQWKSAAEIRLALDPALPSVPCSRSEISQVLISILVNAAQALRELDATPSRRPGVIEISSCTVGERVEIRIHDNGPGIAPDTLPKIFDPFYTTKSPGDGSGLGLSIAHAIVVGRHHGTLDCLSELGTGTTFVIQLPLTSPVPISEETIR